MNRTLFFWIAATALLLSACKQEPTEKQAAAVLAARQMADNKTPAETMGRPAVDQLNDAMPAAGQTPTTTSRTLQLTIGKASVARNSQLCLDITANGFEQLIGMQYSIHWDPALLEYEAVKNFKLPSLDNNDFGSRQTAQGMLTAAWIDDSLKGISVAPGNSLYQICFTAKGESGKQAVVKFHNQPTPYEVIDKNEAILRFEGVSGSVTIQ